MLLLNIDKKSFFIVVIISGGNNRKPEQYCLYSKGIAWTRDYDLLPNSRASSDSCKITLVTRFNKPIIQKYLQLIPSTFNYTFVVMTKYCNWLQERLIFDNCIILFADLCRLLKNYAFSNFSMNEVAS